MVMKKIFSFDYFILERLGMSDDVLTQAKEIFDLINSDESKFLFEYKYKLNGAPLKGPTDSLADQIIYGPNKATKIFVIKIRIGLSPGNRGGAGIFSGDDMTIYLDDRSDLATLTHELKHADRFLRMGSKVHQEEFTKLKGIASSKQQKNIRFKGFVNLEMFLYYLQKEEFEAFFHDGHVKFKEYMENAFDEGLWKHMVNFDIAGAFNYLSKNSKDKPLEKKDVVRLWNQYNDTNREPATKTTPGYFTPYLFYSGKLKPGKYTLQKSTFLDIGLHLTIPEKQRPFKFENWFDKKTIDSTIWEYLKNKNNINDTKTGLDFYISKVVNSLGFETSPPDKYSSMIEKYKNSLEKQIEQRMETYSRKFARIPTLVMMELDK